MDKLVRKIEIPLAKKAIERAGLYIVQKKEDIDRLAIIDPFRLYMQDVLFANTLSWASYFTE